MSINYAVEIGEYAKRHFISEFKKKYHGAWDVTITAIEEEMRRVEALIGTTNFIEIITSRGDLLICKTEFRIAKTKESRHSSGNRCVVAVHRDKQLAIILLVYGKGNVKGGHETEWWKSLIRDGYPDYSTYI